MLKINKIIGILLILISLTATVVLWFAMNKAEASYEKVNVTVESAQKVTRKIKKSSITFNEVKVRYNGEIRDLENCHDTYSYPEGKTVTAYLSGGKLYANIEGVKTSTPIAKAYFFFLLLTFALIIGIPVYWSVKANKKGAA